MSNENIVWVTGSAGFIGGVLVRRFEREGYVVVGTDVELSVTESDRIEAFANEVRPSVIINSAGIPRAGVGLSNRVKAYEVNALGARNVAVAANAVGALMVQVSTDDVYPVRMPEPANEFDAPHPETPYGKSKRAGEMMVRDTMPDHLIVRASWLYDRHGGQLKGALDAAAEGRTIPARTDQYASPTSASLYADFLVKAIERRATGVLHIVTRGVTSRYDILTRAMELCGYEPNHVLVPESDVVTSEQVLLESLMLEMFGAQIPTWEEDLETYLKAAGLAK